jgi:hypothetical protein
MRMGGNDKCNDYLQKQGIGPRTPIKQKYESPAAQLYKLVIKARVEGRPEPKTLPPAAPRTAPANLSTDRQGKERLAGETDNQYIMRQTRLTEEAKARMSNKFGNGGFTGGSRMQGIGSDSSYNPNAGFGAASLVTGMSSLMSGAGQAASTMVSTDNVNSLKQTGSSFWGSLTSTVSTVSSSITAPAEDDGLSSLQRRVASSKPSNSIYSGFGSDTGPGSSMPTHSSSAGTTGTGSRPGLAEAKGLQGEDPNGIARLTGESDEQYVMRQTRLREEARARMAAKFGNGGLSSATSSSAPAPAHVYPGNRSAPSSGNFSGFGGAGGGGGGGTSGLQEAKGMAGEDPNGIERLTGESEEQYVIRQTRLREEATARMAAKFGGQGLSSAGSAPAPAYSSNTRAAAPARTKSGEMNTGDFFSSFGT